MTPPVTPLIAPALLAALHAPHPQLLVLDSVAGAEALALPGLGLWLVRAAPGAPARLYPPGGDPAAASLPLPGLPALLLGLVAPDAAAAGVPAALATAGEAPGVVVAADAAAALPAVAAALIAALAAQAAASGDLHRALVAARREAEDTRLALIALTQQVGQRMPPAPLEEVLTLLPSPAGDVAAAEGGQLSVGQSLGLPLRGLAALALRPAEALVGAAAGLRVRLYGAESGETFGAWLVPGAALTADEWLTLDLPTPIGPVRETATLDIRAELEPGDALALALEAQTTAPAGAAQIRGGAPQDRALALRAWTAPFGRRFAVPAHWDAAAVGLPLLPAGVPVALPAQIWAEARYPHGQVRPVALGGEAAPLLASFGPGRGVAIVLPAVPVNGLDLLQATVEVAQGDPASLEAALWLQPAEAPVALEADLSTLPPGARWSGWRRPDAGGGPLRLPLALPLRGPDSVAVVLVLRHTGAEPPLRVQWSGLVGFRQPQPVPAPADRPVAPPPMPEPVAPLLPRPRKGAEARGAALAARSAMVPAAPPAAPPASHPPQAGTIRLEEFYASPDGGYRHLDLWLEGVRGHGQDWARLRVKLALRGEGPCLEFRIRPGWPQIFDQWPGTERDEWGPFYLVGLADLAAGIPPRVRTERDRRLLATLLHLLPRAVDQVARELPGEAGDPGRWRTEAGRLAAALGMPIG